MPKVRILSGKDVVKILGKFGFSLFTQLTQRGSHMKFRREIGDHEQVLTVPNHKELDKGTIHAIYIQASRFFPEEDLRELFYSE